MLADTSAAMLVGTSAPEIYSKLHLHIPLVGTSQPCLLVRPQQCLLIRPHQKSILSHLCIYVGWHESDMLAGTSAVMLANTSASETYSKFGLHFRWLAQVRHACWYVRSNACWYVLEKIFSVPFRCLRCSLALRNFSIVRLAQVRHAWRYFTSDKNFDQMVK